MDNVHSSQIDWPGPEWKKKIANTNLTRMGLDPKAGLPDAFTVTSARTGKVATFKLRFTGDVRVIGWRHGRQKVGYYASPAAPGLLIRAGVC
jgi:hypothetical protein